MTLTLRAPQSSLMFVLSWGLCFFGCSESDQQEAAQYQVPGSFDADEIARVVATAYCDAFRRCQPDIRPTYFLLRDTCVGRLAETLGHDLGMLVPAIEEDRIIYSPSGLGTCLSAISGSTCHEIDIEAFEVHCAAPFEGTVMQGERCHLDSECHNGFCPGEDGCLSRCRPLADVGESCEFDGERQCLAGLDCDQSRRCAPKGGLAFRASEGQRCDIVRCRPGFHCRVGGERRCDANERRFSKGAGEACPGLDDPGIEATCSADLLCAFPTAEAEATAGQCMPVPTIGQPCHPAATTPDSWCEHGSYCHGVNPEMGVYRGECLPLPMADQPCGPHYGAPQFCRTGGRCVDGICRPLAAVSNACSQHQDCLAGRCVNQVCTLACLDDLDGG